MGAFIDEKAIDEAIGSVVAAQIKQAASFR